MVLRKALAVVLSAVALTFGAPIVGVAQGQAPKASSLRGQVVDTGGRGAMGMNVELVSQGLVVSTTLSGPDGHFSFAGLPADNYVVRTTVNGQPSGVRVSVVPGEVPQTALIVLPSIATASPAVVAVIGVSGVASLISVTIAVVAGQIVVETTNDNDTNILFETRAEAATFVRNEIQAQLGLPPNNAVAQQIFNQIINNIPVGSGSL